ALRSAGFAARDVKLTSSGSAEERVALQEPGVVHWTDWAADVGVRECGAACSDAWAARRAALSHRLQGAVAGALVSANRRAA
ncbi:MAG: hypothetical protein M3P91_02280, partial [Actinomycetota bacterium]|nr:hypothetical protein [Actinomycetota bacterium]